MKRVAILLLAALLLAGCSLLPKTPKESVMACYYTVRTAYDTAADLRARGKLSDASRAAVLKKGDQATAACDTARKALALGDIKGTESALKAAEAILIEIEKELK
jgi:hypothetical protein